MGSFRDQVKGIFIIALLFLSFNQGKSQSYCKVEVSQPSTYIDLVELVDLKHTSGEDGYGDFTNVGTTLGKDQFYNLLYSIVKPEGTPASRIEAWIDFNQDGDFEDDQESLFSWDPIESSEKVSFSFYVPPTALSGATRLRIKVNAVSDTHGPCSPFSDGEVEDYSVYIKGEDSFCIPLSTGDAHIKRVQVGDIDHVSGNEGRLGDFRYLSTSIMRGERFTLTLEKSANSNILSRIRVDFNQDGDFDDVGEHSESVATIDIWNDNPEEKLQLTVPPTAQLGKTTLQVQFGYADCDNERIGETELYTLNIVDAPSYAILGYKRNFSFVSKTSGELKFQNNQVVIDHNADGTEGGRWKVVPGLADPSAFSFESVEFPGHYLRHQGFKLYLHEKEATPAHLMNIFNKDATFWAHPGFSYPHANYRGAVAFESFNYPGLYITYSDNGLFIREVENDEDILNLTDSELKSTFKLIPHTEDVITTSSSDVSAAPESFDVKLTSANPVIAHEAKIEVTIGYDSWINVALTTEGVRPGGTPIVTLQHEDFKSGTHELAFDLSTTAQRLVGGSALTPGVYILSVRTNQHKKGIKLVVE